MNRGRIPWTRHAASALAVALMLLSRSASAAAPPDIAAMTQREIALIQFYGGGSPLTAQEQREAAEIVQRGLEHAPQAEQAADAGAARLLQILARAPAPLIAQAREGGRLNAQLHDAVSPALREQQAMETQIIIAHDPVVVFDSAHKLLVSVQTLRVLQQADTFGAHWFGVPPPRPDFVAQMQPVVPRAWPGMDAGMKDAMAHAERDLPYAPGFLQGINPQKRAAFAETWRAKIMAAPDAVGQQLNLAEVMAVVGMTAFRLRQSGGSGATGAAVADPMREQDLVNRQMLGAVRSYSPSCNVTRPDAMNNFSYCHP